MSKVLDDRALANSALVALRRRPSRFTLPDGTSVRIPKAAVDGLIELLTAAAEGDEATIVRSPRELTTASGKGFERIPADGCEADRRRRTGRRARSAPIAECHSPICSPFARTS